MWLLTNSSHRNVEMSISWFLSFLLQCLRSWSQKQPYSPPLPTCMLFLCDIVVLPNYKCICLLYPFIQNWTHGFICPMTRRTVIVWHYETRPLVAFHVAILLELCSLALMITWTGQRGYNDQRWSTPRKPIFDQPAPSKLIPWICQHQPSMT